LVVLGPKWEQSATIFAGFATVALFVPLCSSCSWLLVTQGRGKDALKSSLIVSCITAASVLVGLPWGGVGVAISSAISSLFVQIPVLYRIAGREGPVSTRDLWIHLLHHLPLWGVVCSVAWLVGTRFVTSAPLIQLMVGGVAGLGAGAAFICFSSQSRRVTWNLVDSVRQFAATRQVGVTLS
jgi:polysaccharide transporter, PST family